MTRGKNPSLRTLLEDGHSLPPAQFSLIRRIASLAAERGLALYLVGGFVRDLLLARPTLDHDFVLEGDAVPFARALVKKFGGRVTTHPAFHTATWFLPSDLLGEANVPGAFDLISARSETYAHPAALPTVTLGDISDDLRRRDFTINAMSVRLNDGEFGDLLDPFDGQADLRKGMVRVLHARSFIDDPTRIFRAVRYAERYGFKLALQTRELIPAALKYVDRLSPERLRHELDLILEEENSSAMLARLANLGLLAAVKPALPEFPAERAHWLDHRVPVDFGLTLDRAALGYLLWLMDAPEETLASLTDRLGFTAPLTKSVRAAARLKADLPSLEGARPSQWVERLERVPPDAIYAVRLVTRQEALQDYLLTWRHIYPSITGDDLKARGLPPGPKFKHILTRLRSAWLDGEVSTPKEEEFLLESLL